MHHFLFAESLYCQGLGEQQTSSLNADQTVQTEIIKRYVLNRGVTMKNLTIVVFTFCGKESHDRSGFLAQCERSSEL